MKIIFGLLTFSFLSICFFHVSAQTSGADTIVGKHPEMDLHQLQPGKV
jgi:hypothetical protein